MRDYLSTQLDVDFDELTRLWTKECSKQLVNCLVEDTFNKLMKWARNTDTVDDYIEEELLKIFNTQLPANPDNTLIKKHHNAIKNMVDSVHTHIDPLYVLVVEIISDIVEENPWRVWHLKKFSTNIFIEWDEDYRVMVFNEKVESGEWKLEGM